MTSGTIKITDERDRRYVVRIFDEKFDSLTQLRKLLFRMNGTGYTITVLFDNPIANEDKI